MSFESLREELLEKASQEVMERFEQPDIHVVRAVNVLDELDRLFNQLFEQVSEWYAVHFPELSRNISDNEKFLELVVGLGERKNFSKKEVERVLVEEELSLLVCEKAVQSVGSGIGKNVLSQIQGLAKLALQIKKQRTELEGFVSEETKKVLPEFSSIAGSLLAARMLKQAGSLKKLAFLPSSAIQVLGAEKALFRHMRFGAKPPKHGLLYQHPLVQKAPYNEKGKAARKLAGKLAIAVKKDFFGK